MWWIPSVRKALTEIGWESMFRGCVNPRNRNGSSVQVSLALETPSNGF